MFKVFIATTYQAPHRFMPYISDRMQPVLGQPKTLESATKKARNLAKDRCFKIQVLDLDTKEVYELHGQDLIKRQAASVELSGLDWY